MEQIMSEERFVLVEKALRSTNILMSRKNLCFDIELKNYEIRDCLEVWMFNLYYNNILLGLVQVVECCLYSWRNEKKT